MNRRCARSGSCRSDCCTCNVIIICYYCVVIVVVDISTMQALLQSMIRDDQGFVMQQSIGNITIIVVTEKQPSKHLNSRQKPIIHINVLSIRVYKLVITFSRLLDIEVSCVLCYLNRIKTMIYAFYGYFSICIYLPFESVFLGMPLRAKYRHFGGFYGTCVVERCRVGL